MKRTGLYIILILALLAVVGLFITGKGKKKRLDERVTLKRQDKLPYGTYVAFNSLPDMFPNASVIVSRELPGYWDSLDAEEPNQAYIVITDMFNADEYDMRKLINFAQNGNDVFISARYISAAADRILGCNSTSYDMTYVSVNELERNVKLSLESPPFRKKEQYVYPGRSYYSYFTSIDTAVTSVYGYDKVPRPMFIHLRAGKGNLFVHLEPLAFSNYFLLHKQNISYYEKVISLINPGVTRIIWDEYFLNKKSNSSPQSKKSWVTVLLRYPGFRAGLITAILILLLYVLMELRRKQRYIPVVQKPRNDSMDFVKTIGRLYYEKGDHRNLAKKMSAYFLEHVRSQYKLPTGTLDEVFIRNLQYKSGADEVLIREIISFIKYTDETAMITAAQLTEFHKKLETFYTKT